MVKLVLGHVITCVAYRQSFRYQPDAGATENVVPGQRRLSCALAAAGVLVHDSQIARPHPLAKKLLSMALDVAIEPLL